MASYVPATDNDRALMLDALGLRTLEALYAEVPGEVLLDALPALRAGADDPAFDIDMAEGGSEQQVMARMAALAGANTVFPTVLRGAGAYRHFIPGVARAIPAKETFLTAYTPYQAEMSQGLLQAIFEFQTMVCELTGMDAANASVYDGATAAAEAAAMCRERARTRTLVSAGVHPQVLQVVRTYCQAVGAPCEVVPLCAGRTDARALEAMLGAGDACLLMQQPNYYGVLEDAQALGALAHAAGAKLVMSVNPLAAAVLRTPAECGADIAVGDGQPLGLPMAFGGPSVGFMATRQALTRRLPGRIVGQTQDAQGRRAFVLTLQAREQHIRREKASSNICSNQALCALTAGVYMAAMGPQGVQEAARQSYDHAHALADAICAVPGFARGFAAPFFHEFVTTCPVPAARVMAALEAQGILGGLPLAGEMAGHILWCATELMTPDVPERVCRILREVCA